MRQLITIRPTKKGSNMRQTIQRPPQRNVVIEMLRALKKLTTEHVEENLDDVISYRATMSTEDSEYTTTSATNVPSVKDSAENFLPMEETDVIDRPPIDERSASNVLSMEERIATNDFQVYKTPEMEEQRDEPGTSYVISLQLHTPKLATILV